MLRIVCYLFTKAGKIKGGGLILHHGCILRTYSTVFRKWVVVTGYFIHGVLVNDGSGGGVGGGRGGKCPPPTFGSFIAPYYRALSII